MLKHFFFVRFEVLINQMRLPKGQILEGFSEHQKKCNLTPLLFFLFSDRDREKTRGHCNIIF